MNNLYALYSLYKIEKMILKYIYINKLYNYIKNQYY
jgi:hypothetical protein